LGWTPENAIGKDLAYGGVKGKVIGVMEDFHFESMHQKIVPLLFLVPGASRTYYGSLSVNISGNNIPSTLRDIEKTYKSYLPEIPFQSGFLNERYNKLYESEQQQGSLFSIFSAIAIFIACLGLFGLSAFAITQRIKEIGIRKVLGATTGSIVTLLSTDFLKLVIIASVIAFPVAWYVMNTWLQDFAYRINIPWWAFVLAGILAVCITLFTISFQAIKAAMANPVKSLRSE
jgi:putative ABC transport system permease protein